MTGPRGMEEEKEVSVAVAVSLVVEVWVSVSVAMMWRDQKEWAEEKKVSLLQSSGLRIRRSQGKDLEKYKNQRRDFPSCHFIDHTSLQRRLICDQLD